MLLVQRLKHVNYNFLYSTMQKPFLTGLRLKNSLTSQVVTLRIFSNSSNLEMVKLWDGIHADPLCTPTATWDMQGKICLSIETTSAMIWFGES